MLLYLFQTVHHEKTVHLSLTLVLSSVALVLLIDESFAIQLRCTYNTLNSMIIHLWQDKLITTSQVIRYFFQVSRSLRSILQSNCMRALLAWYR